MKVLHLTLKKKWFDMIASGEKKEDYREIKPYYVSRLVDELRASEEGRFGSFFWKGFWCTMQTPESYDMVTFRNGYSKSAPTISFKIRDIVDGQGKQEWGAEPGKEYFVIKLGKKTIIEMSKEQDIVKGKPDLEIRRFKTIYTTFLKLNQAQRLRALEFMISKYHSDIQAKKSSFNGTTKSKTPIANPHE